LENTRLGDLDAAGSMISNDRRGEVFGTLAMMDVMAIFQQSSVGFRFSPPTVFITNQFAPRGFDRRAWSVIHKFQDFLRKP
jgi:hypothetical protein